MSLGKKRNELWVLGIENAKNCCTEVFDWDHSLKTMGTASLILFPLAPSCQMAFATLRPRFGGMTLGQE